MKQAHFIGSLSVKATVASKCDMRAAIVKRPHHSVQKDRGWIFEWLHVMEIWDTL